MNSPVLLRQLLLDELADLELYQALRPRAKGELAKILDAFIVTEIRHADFWRQSSGYKDTKTNLKGKLRNLVLLAAVRCFGSSAAFLILEAVEVHGVNKYIRLWERQTDVSIQKGLETILLDELQHEDEAVMGGRDRAIRPETVRNAFLGFNDGSVEILGAVSGFAAAFADPTLVVISGLTVSVAGSLSMAAGAFLSTHSEQEVQALESGKQRFLLSRSQAAIPTPERGTSPWKASALVGVSYLIGAAVPVAPFLLGAHEPWWSLLFSGVLILAVSAILAFLSGMSILRRVLLNTGVLFAAVGISSVVGLAAHHVFGV